MVTDRPIVGPLTSGVDPCEQGCETFHSAPCRRELLAELLDIGLRTACIEFDQNITGLDGLSLADVNGLDGTDLQRLYDLTVTTGYNAPLRHGHDIYFAY